MKKKIKEEKESFFFFFRQEKESYFSYVLSLSSFENGMDPILEEAILFLFFFSCLVWSF